MLDHDFGTENLSIPPKDSTDPLVRCFRELGVTQPIVMRSPQKLEELFELKSPSPPSPTHSDDGRKISLQLKIATYLAAKPQAGNWSRIHLSGSNIDIGQMLPAFERPIFSVGMEAILQQSLKKDFQQFSSLLDYMAKGRQTLQIIIADEMRPYYKKTIQTIGGFDRSNSQPVFPYSDFERIMHAGCSFQKSMLLTFYQEKSKQMLFSKQTQSELFPNKTFAQQEQEETLFSIQKAIIDTIMDTIQRVSGDSLSFSKLDVIVWAAIDNAIDNMSGCPLFSENISFDSFKKEIRKLRCLENLPNYKQQILSLLEQKKSIFEQYAEKGNQHAGVMTTELKKIMTQLNKGKIQTLEQINDLLEKDINSLHSLEFFAGILSERSKFGAIRPHSVHTSFKRYEVAYQGKINQYLKNQREQIMVGSIGNKDIPLTVTSSFLKRWDHTEVEYFPEINAHLESIYQDIQTLTPSPKSKAIVLEKCAEIHWWLAHMCPFERGSAAVANLVVAHLLKKHGMVPAPWKPNISPDLEAFTLPMDEFKKKYIAGKFGGFRK